MAMMYDERASAKGQALTTLDPHSETRTEDAEPASSPTALEEQSSSAVSPFPSEVETKPSPGWLRWLKKPFASKDRDVRQSLESIVEADLAQGQATANLGDDERRMIRNILQYHEVCVDDVMVPHADIIAIDEQESFESLVSFFIEAAHSRIPVFRDTLDNVVGMVHIKDVVAPLTPKANGQPRKQPSIASLVRSVLYVPPSMRVIDLLARMRAARIHMAIVVDEFGGTDGLITIEDLVEQIVGDIEDEHDEEQRDVIASVTEGEWLADARVEISNLEETLGAAFGQDEDDIDTLGGLVVSIAGRVPVIGEQVRHDAGFLFEVIDGDPRRIKQVRISRDETPPASPPSPK
ncbi:MAG: hemolysin family protein [Pseudomonadota bacterium]